MQILFVASKSLFKIKIIFQRLQFYVVQMQPMWWADIALYPLNMLQELQSMAQIWWPYVTTLQ